MLILDGMADMIIIKFRAVHYTSLNGHTFKVVENKQDWLITQYIYAYIFDST